MFSFLPPLGHLFWKVCALISFTLLFLLTVTPAIQGAMLFPHIDKLFHFIAFAGVSFAFLFAYVELSRKLLFFSLSAIGLCIEIIQYYVPGRSFSWLDLLADCLGALFIYWIFPKRKEK